MSIETDAGAVDEAATVLLLAPDAHGTTARTCAKLLDHGENRLDRAVALTLDQSASAWLDAWDRHASPSSTAVTCVDVNGETRSAAADAVPSRANATVERVRDATNLERVGRTVSDVLERAAEDDERVGLAVHSLTGVLQHADESTAFKFAYTLGEVVREVDGVVFFHLDADAHDEETVETFSMVCDTVVELERDVATGDPPDG